MITNRLAIEPITSVKAVEFDPQQLGNQYLADVLTPSYHVSNGFFGNERCYFLIRYQEHSDKEPMGTGAKLVVDIQQRAVIPLTDEQIQDISEAPHVYSAQTDGTLARDEEGHLLRYQAKRNATEYLRESLSMNYSAIGGLLVPFPEQPVWQFLVRFRMAQTGEIEPLGIIDVDAYNGDVIPLQASQLQRIKSRVNAIIQHSKLSSTE